MTGQADVEADGIAALDSDLLGNHRQRLLGVAERRESSAGVDPLAIEILDVGGHVGQPPGNRAVPSKRDRRRAGQRGADEIDIPRRDVGEIPGRRRFGTKMRIVGEQRFAGRAEASHQQPSCSSRVIRPTRRRAGSRGRREALLRARADRAPTESPPFEERPNGAFLPVVIAAIVIAQNVRNHVPAKYGEASIRRRWHELSHPFHAHRTNEVVSQQFERIIRAQVPRHHLHPDHDVNSGPGFGLKSQQRELRRKQGVAVGRDVGVHPCDVGVDLFLRPGRHMLPGALRRAPESDRPQKAILRHSGGAEDLRQSAVSDAALEFHLPEPILGVHVSQPEQRIGQRRRENVRDGVGVAHDLDRRGNPGDGQLCRRSAATIGADRDSSRPTRSRRARQRSQQPHALSRAIGAWHNHSDCRLQIADCRGIAEWDWIVRLQSDIDD